MFLTTVQAPVQRVDNAIHRIYHYPVNNIVCFANFYPLDRHLSSGKRYPPFEQLAPDYFELSHIDKNGSRY